MDDDRNCTLLFEYLRSILYDPKTQPLDIDALDEPFRKLGMGLQYLDHAVEEMKEYSEALSNGTLSVTPPGRDNFLCENLKNIHANLNHLTWQAKQVAKGDYTQRVSYLGEFSEAFNSMTAQLKERETALKEEALQEKEQASMDPLTHVGNRYYFQREVEELLKTDEELVFCYCDLDHLKYINDNYGHGEGDWYLRHFTKSVKKKIRENDLFARLGGDEFCIILKDCPQEVAYSKMYWIQHDFAKKTDKPYEKNFSFGIVRLPAGHGPVDLEKLIHEADYAMYQQKRSHNMARPFLGQPYHGGS